MVVLINYWFWLWKVVPINNFTTDEEDIDGGTDLLLILTLKGARLCGGGSWERGGHDQDSAGKDEGLLVAGFYDLLEV